VAWRVEVVSETGSTNADLLASGRVGAEDRSVLIAEHQTGGRGRLGRTWEAPAGASLLMSILRRPVAATDAHRAVQQVAVAAALAATELSGLPVELKWPNDLLVGESKLAGVLAEHAVDPAGDPFVVVGLGMNLHWAPPGAARLGDVDRSRLIERICDHLDALDARLDRGFAQYRELLATLGSSVRVDLVTESFSGTAVDVDADGALRVDTEHGPRRVVAGDVVHLRPAS
jgi:BirA family biotin operon repressor/biotin-[acetyl-CoA-carboxylase] ligase